MQDRLCDMQEHDMHVCNVRPLLPGSRRDAHHGEAPFDLLSKCEPLTSTSSCSSWGADITQ